MATIKKDVIELRERWRKHPDFGCFWSSPDNERGLRLTPTIEPGRLFVDMTVEKEHSGFPGIVHGGIPYSIIDGLMSWYLISHFGRAGFTKECSMEYRRPLLVGKTYRFQVKLKQDDRVSFPLVPLYGEVFEVVAGNVSEELLQSVSGVFFLPNRKTAKKVLGIDLGAEGDELFPEL